MDLANILKLDQGIEDGTCKTFGFVIDGNVSEATNSVTTAVKAGNCNRDVSLF